MYEYIVKYQQIQTCYVHGDPAIEVTLVDNICHAMSWGHGRSWGHGKSWGHERSRGYGRSFSCESNKRTNI